MTVGTEPPATAPWQGATEPRKRTWTRSEHPKPGTRISSPPKPQRFRLADAITQGNGHIRDEIWNAVAAHYDEGQLVELVGVIALFNYFNRFNNALEIEVTRPGWPSR